MLTTIINKLIRQQDLSATEIINGIDTILQTTNEVQSAAFISLLSAKGLNAAELGAIVKTLRSAICPVEVSTPVLDIVGTGGDAANTINISTAAAILAASCGVNVAKHGNHAASSQCGSADVLQALGFDLQQSPTAITAMIAQENFGFCYAPSFSSNFKNLRQLRKQLGVPTCFNQLGPLLNPADPEYLMIGVTNLQTSQLMVEVLRTLAIKHALVFYCDGIDELTCIASSNVMALHNGVVSEFVINPTDYGLPLCTLSDLQGGSPECNAKLLVAGLKGENLMISNTFILNAGVACYVYGVVPSIAEGIALARQQILSGAAIAKLTSILNFKLV